MANISDFLGQMSTGGARPNQFQVEIPELPWATQSKEASTAIRFLCRAATLPASTIQDIQASYRGRPVHFAGERTFQPWVVDIYNDNNFLIRTALEEWSTNILRYGSTKGSIVPSSYYTEMDVVQLDRNDHAVKAYRFFNVYPTNIGPVQLAFDQNAAIEEFQVEFTYNYFAPIDDPYIFTEISSAA